MATHIAIMDDNPITILTPLLDSEMNADGLLLIHTHSQQAKVENFVRLVSEYQIPVKTWILPDTLSTDEIFTSLRVLLEQYQGEAFCFNASNGDRHVVLAATNLCRTYGFDIFVLEPRRDAVSWLVPVERKPTEIADIIRLPTMFRLFDAKLVSTQRKQSLQADVRKLGALWAAKAQEYAKPLGRLNYLAMNSKNFVTQELDDYMHHDRKLQSLIGDLAELGYLEVKQNRLHFTSSEARFFANGGWLEEYVFSVVDLLRHEFKQIQDLAQGVKVVREFNSEIIENEIDVAFVANNKLHLIECKAKRFDDGGAKSIAYKLDAITDILGGIHARALLVSYAPLSQGDRLRADAQGVKVVAGQELGRLKEHLRQWLEAC